MSRLTGLTKLAWHPKTNRYACISLLSIQFVNYYQVPFNVQHAKKHTIAAIITQYRISNARHHLTRSLYTTKKTRLLNELQIIGDCSSLFFFASGVGYICFKYIRTSGVFVLHALKHIHLVNYLWFMHSTNHKMTEAEWKKNSEQKDWSIRQ